MIGQVVSTCREKYEVKIDIVEPLRKLEIGRLQESIPFEFGSEITNGESHSQPVRRHAFGPRPISGLDVPVSEEIKQKRNKTYVKIVEDNILFGSL